jgi:hypothetical protein
LSATTTPTVTPSITSTNTPTPSITTTLTVTPSITQTTTQTITPTTSVTPTPQSCVACLDWPESINVQINFNNIFENPSCVCPSWGAWESQQPGSYSVTSKIFTVFKASSSPTAASYNFAANNYETAYFGCVSTEPNADMYVNITCNTYTKSYNVTFSALLFCSTFLDRPGADNFSYKEIPPETKTINTCADICNLTFGSVTTNAQILCGLPISPTPTPTNTPTNTTTPTNTPTPTVTATPAITPSMTVTPTLTNSPTVTPTQTSTITPTVTATITLTPTITSTITPTPSITRTNTPTPSVSPSPQPFT